MTSTDRDTPFTFSEIMRGIDARTAALADRLRARKRWLEEETTAPVAMTPLMNVLRE